MDLWDLKEFPTYVAEITHHNYDETNIIKSTRLP